MSAGCHECEDESGSSTPVSPTVQGKSLVVGAVALTALRPGQTGMIHATSLETGDADLLRAMGLRLSARVRLCRLGEPCIVEVLGGGESCARKGGCVCRIGLARPLADKVLVSAIEGG